MKIDRYLKAIISALVSGGAVYIVSRAGGMTADEWGDVVMAVLAGLGLVYAVPNAKAKPDAGETKAEPLHVETTVVPSASIAPPTQATNGWWTR